MSTQTALSLRSRLTVALAFLAALLVGLPLRADAADVSYTYDSLNRLTMADYGNGLVINYTYDAAGNRLSQKVVPAPILSKLLSPTNGATFPSASVTFNWDTGTRVDQYSLWVGSSPGTYDLYAKAAGSALTDTVSLPVDGRRVYVTLWSMVNGAWSPDYTNQYAFTALQATKASFSGLANGATLTSSTLALNWKSGTGASQYALWVGSAPQTYDLYAGTEGVSLSKTLTVPTDGRDIYVTLWSCINGQWTANHYTYKTFSAPSSGKAQMVSPTNATTLTGSSATLNWNAGSGISRYALWVGSEPQSYDIFGAEVSGLSKTLTLPMDGSPVYVSLWSYLNGGWQSNSYWYYTYKNPALTGSVKARISTPANGSVLTSASTPFSWDAGTGATQYSLWVGSSPGTYDLYAGVEGTNLSRAVTLPTDGRPIYVRLWSLINGAWDYNTYMYTAKDTKASMATPANNATLPSASTTFAWNSSSTATQYALWAGSAPGAYDLYAGVEGANLSKAVTLPTDGRPIYVRLWSLINGAWDYNTYMYTAKDTKASIATPANNATLLSASTTFTWNSSSTATQYALWVGSAPGAYDLYAGVEDLKLSKTVALPTDGRPIYVRLWSMINGAWAYNSYIYQATGP